MADKHTFALRLYDTKVLVLTLVGILSLGTMILFGFQQIWNIPRWTQFAGLTVLIAVAFIVSRCLATRPANVQIRDRTITIEQTRQPAKIISLQDIESFTYYEEILLYSLKISLASHEMLSIIDFKWGDKTDFRAFLRQFESQMSSSGDRSGAVPILGTESFYHSRVKNVITISLIVIFGFTAIFLNIKHAFDSWNPICIYFFWVLPTAFFLKMWLSK